MKYLLLKYLLSVVREINFVPDFRRQVLDSLNFHLFGEFRVKVTSCETQISAFPDQTKVAKLKCYVIFHRGDFIMAIPTLVKYHRDCVSMK